MPLRNQVPGSDTLIGPWQQVSFCNAFISIATLPLLRDTSDQLTQDMTPFPNVRVQDQGAKMGANGVENGVNVVPNFHVPQNRDWFCSFLSAAC